MAVLTTRRVAAKPQSLNKQSPHEDLQNRALNRLGEAVQSTSHVQQPPHIITQLQRSVGNRATTGFLTATGCATGPASLNMLTQLQRSVGNRATVRFLTATGHATSPASLMRFPSAVLDKPLKNKDWNKYTKTVKKSSEGVSGGVYFFESKRGSVKKVVVKAEDRSEDEKNTANALISSAGIAVPKGRNVQVGSTEGMDIIGAAQKRGGYDLTQTGMGGYSATEFLEVMTVAAGTSLSSAAKKAGSGAPEHLQTNINQLIQLLSSNSMRQQLATLMARDTIAGSADRVIKQGLANIGNIMVKEAPETKALPRALQSRITAIDNEADQKANFSYGVTREALEDLAKNPARFVDSLLGSIAFSLENSENPQAKELFQNHPQYGALRSGLLESLMKAAMKEALLGTRSHDSKPEQKLEAELRRRRLIVWNLLSS